MNVFKKLMIKIICCAIVCTAMIPCDVYGMKRKADALGDEEEARNVRQRTTEPETKAPVDVPTDKDGKSSSNSSNSGETKQEVKQAGKTKNIFSKLGNAQLGLGKKFSYQDRSAWVGSLPDNSSPQHDPDVRDKTDTIIKIILHAPAQVTNFIQLYLMLPEGIYYAPDEGSPRRLVIDALDKEAQKYVDRQSKLSQEQEKEALAKLPAGYLKMKVRALQQGKGDSVNLRRLIECIFIPRTENAISLFAFHIGEIDGLINDIMDLLIERDKLEPITTLDLHYNKLTHIERLDQLVNLKELSLYDNPIVNQSNFEAIAWPLKIRGVKVIYIRNVYFHLTDCSEDFIEF